MSFCTFSRRSAIATGVLTTIVLLIALVLLVLIGVFDILVDNMIAKSIAITPSSTVYENWVAPNTPIFFSIYLFNITNQPEILQGKKPRIQQIGPYVYREKREKTNISWPNGDQSKVSFYQRLTFHLDLEHSAGDPYKDMVVGISTPFVTVASNMAAGLGPSEDEYHLLMWFTTPELFVKKTVHEFLWGYVDKLTETCNLVTPEKCPFAEVGLMMGKNATDMGPFVVDTGVNDISQLGQVLSYEGKSTVDVWSSEKANQIRGTDGSHFAPKLNANSTVSIFVNEFCRSFELKVDGYGKLTNSDKVKVLSLVGTPETAEPASVNPDNLGFCPPKTPGPKCPPAGLFDLSSCRRQGDSRPPVYSSQPYFFGADPKLREGVDGLPEPNVDNSSTKVYVEPKLGLVLEAYKRIQISFYVRPNKVMSEQFQNWTEPVFLPLVWFEEKALAGPDELAMLYDNAYVKPAKGYNLLLTVFVVVLALSLLLLVFFVIVVCAIRRQTSRSGEGPKSISTATADYNAKYSRVAVTPGDENSAAPL